MWKDLSLPAGKTERVEHHQQQEQLPSMDNNQLATYFSRGIPKPSTYRCTNAWQTDEWFRLVRVVKTTRVYVLEQPLHQWLRESALNGRCDVIVL